LALAGGPARFATADDAVTALISAMRDRDSSAILRVLGSAAHKLVYSGDAVADREARARMVRAYESDHRIDLMDADHAKLIVGTNGWSWPIPIVHTAEGWEFDIASGAQRIIDRRIGHNELTVIELCRAYVEAQREYADMDPMHLGIHAYAATFESKKGARDGLYWESNPGEPQSPLGPLVARARAEGYSDPQGHSRPVPYHGYIFRILTRQGSHAPGGTRDYMVDGKMTRGFAMVAYPARWGDSGVMTFVVNQHGIVYEKNLGPDTEHEAGRILEFDPDSTWKTPGG
jgi:hypothetical protein